MWELDYKESWAPKNWCFWTVVLEKILESPLDCKEIQPVHPKGNQSWIFIGRTDAEAETPILWPPDVKSWLIWKDPDAGKDWGQEEQGTTEDEMVGWHHRFNGHESEWTLGVGDGPGGLACCDSWGGKESDTTERLNWTELREPASIFCISKACPILYFILCRLGMVVFDIVCNEYCILHSTWELLDRILNNFPNMFHFTNKEEHWKLSTFARSLR